MIIIPYPIIDPTALSIGPLSIKWYGLAYVTGIILGWRYCRFLIKRLRLSIDLKDIDDLIPWLALGIVVGGRLGHVLFYDLSYYISRPLEIMMIWQPGMSFHGGLMGVAAVMILFAYKRGIPLLSLTDIIAAATPIGLMFGRMANFINGELYGRITSVPWAMVFPQGGPYARHPSQLYEALLEGAILFAILLFFSLKKKWLKNYPGMITAVFLIGYALSRIIIEFFRQPDAHIGFFIGNSTLGQWLSLPLLFIAIIILRTCYKQFPKV